MVVGGHIGHDGSLIRLRGGMDICKRKKEEERREKRERKGERGRRGKEGERALKPAKQQQFLPFQAVQLFRRPYQASNSYTLRSMHS